MAALLFVAWIIPGLIGHDPWKPDEAYGFGLAVHILHGGSWVVPMLAGEPFVEKPPLYFLTAAACAALFSPPLAIDDAARLATAFYMALTALFLWLTARLLYGTRHAHLALIAFLGCVGLTARGHQLLTDTALLAGLALGLYGLVHAAERPLRGAVCFGTGAGLGFMAKGLLAPGVLGLVALMLPLASRTWRSHKHVLFVAVGIATLLPWLTVWPAALYGAAPDLFREWFFDNNLGRFLGWNELGPRTEHAHYLTILPWYSFPALPLAAWAVWASYRAGGIPTGIRLLLTVFFSMLAVLSASANARDLYALPLLLPLALLVVPAVTTLPRIMRQVWYCASAVAFSLIASVAWFGWIALEFGVPHSVQQWLLQMSPSYEPHFRWLPFVAALTYTFVWVTLLRRLRPGLSRPFWTWSTGLTLLWTLAMTLYINWIDANKTYRPVFASLRAALPRSYDCIASRGLGESERAMLQYFGGIITRRQEGTILGNECDLLLVQVRSNAEPRSDSDGWLIWEGARAGERQERFYLHRTRPSVGMSAALLPPHHSQRKRE
jgi:4-amino-4-deoxy-L-arabinose transferase-like glycosyltransferase